MPLPAHRPQIDGLRLFAFLAIFSFHLNEKALAYGVVGVPLFFVLSGFLITRILLKHESGSLGRDLGVFYARRTLRIFPLYYATLLVLLALGALPRAWWYFLYLNNVDRFLNADWYLVHWPGTTAHFWSLCVEEQFYLLYPPLLLCWPRARRLGLILLLLAGSLAFRGWMEWAHPGARHALLLPSAGEYLLWGGLAGWIDLKLGERPAPAGAVFALGCLVHGLAAVDQFGTGLLGAAGLAPVYQTAHGVGFTLVVFGLWRMRGGPVCRALTLPPIVYLGKISYGLYVFHTFALFTKKALLPYVPALSVVPGGVIALLATIAMASLSWHLFEGPINSLKDRFPYPKARDEAAGPEPDAPTLAPALATR